MLGVPSGGDKGLYPRYLAAGSEEREINSDVILLHLWRY